MTFEAKPLLFRQFGLNYCFQLPARSCVIAYKSFHHCSLASEHKRLRDGLVVRKKEIGQCLIGKTQRVLNVQLLCEFSHLDAIVGATDVESHNLNAFWSILLLQLV